MNDQRALKVLMIDDDEHTLKVASEFLRERGLEVVTSNVPFVAPIIQREHPEVVVLDQHMPLLSGARLLEIMRKNDFCSGIPVIFFSSEEEAVLHRLAFEEKAAGWVSKRQGLEALLVKIRQVCQR